VIVAIHQPNLFPRLKILQKLAAADLWVVLDDVQFASRDYQHRALLQPTRRNQRTRWVTLPVDRARGSRVKLMEAVVKCEYPADHLHRALHGAFHCADDLYTPFAPELAELQRVGCYQLVRYALTTCRTLLDSAGRPPRIVLASKIRDNPKPKARGIEQLLRLVGGSVYIADSGARGYLDDKALAAQGVTTLWQHWRPISSWSAPAVIQRNGSALNLLAADPQRFASAVNDILVTTH
jgi:hypothetical protein